MVIFIFDNHHFCHQGDPLQSSRRLPCVHITCILSGSQLSSNPQSTRTTLSTVPDGPLVSSGLPISLLLIAALVLVFSFLFCGLFLRYLYLYFISLSDRLCPCIFYNPLWSLLRLGLQYLVRKSDDLSGCDEVGGFGQGGDSESLEEVTTPSAPPLPSSPASCAPLPPPPTYNEAVASSPPPKQGAHHLLQAHPQVQPPPYSLLVGPSGPCLARSYTADNSWQRFAWQASSRCWGKSTYQRLSKLLKFSRSFPSVQQEDENRSWKSWASISCLPSVPHYVQMINDYWIYSSVFNF